MSAIFNWKESIMQNMKKKTSELDLTSLEMHPVKKSNQASMHITSLPNLKSSIDEEISPFIPLEVTSPTVAELPKPVQETKKPPLLWMFLALLAHAGWGIYPVLARYLQNVEHLPSMSLLVTGNGAVSIVTFAIVLKRRSFFKILRIKMLPLLIFVTVIRVVTNLLSPRFTTAVNVQLMTIMAPLIVAVLNSIFLKEALPPFTIAAIFFCTLGSLLMLLSSIVPFHFAVSNLDWVGIALAFVSACFLACYMVLVKKCLSGDNNVKGEELLFFLTMPIVIGGAVASLIMQEDWSSWLHLSKIGWLVWIAFAFGILLFGNLLQIGSISHLGAPLVSTLLAFRLVSSLVFSALIMHEELSDVYQFVGAAIVLITVTAYMWFQKRASKK